MKIIGLSLALLCNTCFANEWPVGAWDCRSWGAIRLLSDNYCVDTDPEGLLQDWGMWQYFGNQNAIIIVWMESSRIEIIENNNDEYYHQMSYSFGIGSEIEKVNKIGK